MSKNREIDRRSRPVRSAFSSFQYDLYFDRKTFAILFTHSHTNPLASLAVRGEASSFAVDPCRHFTYASRANSTTSDVPEMLNRSRDARLEDGIYETIPSHSTCILHRTRVSILRTGVVAATPVAT